MISGHATSAAAFKSPWGWRVSPHPERVTSLGKEDRRRPLTSTVSRRRNWLARTGRTTPLSIGTGILGFMGPRVTVPRLRPRPARRHKGAPRRIGQPRGRLPEHWTTIGDGG